VSFLQKRNKYWYLYEFNNGKLSGQSLKTTDRETAKEYQRKHDENKARNTLGLPLKNITWKQFKEQYLSYSKTSKRPRSYQKDCFILEDYEKTTEINNITQFDNISIENYKLALSKRNCSIATINRYLNTLKNCGTKISEWYTKGINPVTSVRRIKDIRKVNVRYFSEDELKKLFKQLKHFSVWEVATMISLYAGLRREEVCYLKWSDVDFKKGEISVTAKDDWQPKSYINRTNTMPPILLLYLRDVFKGLKDKSTDQWVCKQKDEKRLDSNLLSTMFKKFVKKAGIKGASFHNLRKTNATKIADSGASASFLMSWLGHNSLQPVMVYMGIGEDHKKSIISKISFNTITK